MPTTAVAFRRGSHEENNVFAGTHGEIVADLGSSPMSPRESNPDATVVLHTDNGQPGGIRMAREDMLNVGDEAVNKLSSIGLARSNFSNVTSINNASFTNLLADIGVAKSNATNIITSNLAPIINNVPQATTIENPNTNTVHQNAENYPALLRNDFTNLLPAARDQFAAKNMSNVDTANLATNQSGHIGGNLAYASGSNISTSDLANSSRTLGGALAYRDLSNITANEIKNKIDFDNTLSNYQLKSEKINDITPSNTDSNHYPSTLAIVNYMSQGTVGADRRLSNIIAWDNASKKINEYNYVVSNINTSADSTTHTTGEVITASISGVIFTFTVSSVDGNGKILDVQLSPQSGETQVNSTYATSTNTIFTISSSTIIVGKLMLADLSNSEIEARNSSNYETYSSVYYNLTRDSSNNITRVSEVGMNIASQSYQGNISTELGTDNSAQSNFTVVKYHTSNNDIVIDGYSGLFVKNDKVYLNRNEYTTSDGERVPVMDTNHEVLRRSDVSFPAMPTANGVYHLVVNNGVASWVADSHLTYVP